MQRNLLHLCSPRQKVLSTKLSQQKPAAETEMSLWLAEGWVTTLTKASWYWKDTHTHTNTSLHMRCCVCVYSYSNVAALGGVRGGASVCGREDRAKQSETDSPLKSDPRIHQHHHHGSVLPWWNHVVWPEMQVDASNQHVASRILMCCCLKESKHTLWVCTNKHQTVDTC